MPFYAVIVKVPALVEYSGSYQLIGVMGRHLAVHDG